MVFSITHVYYHGDIFYSARSLRDEEAAIAFAKLQNFLSLPEPQT